MTKTALDTADINYEHLDCDPELADTAEFCKHYKFDLDEAANAIIVVSKDDPRKFACCVVLATTKLDVNKAVCEQMGVKRASFAPAESTVQVTGMQTGGVTPFGVPADMPVLVDAAVLHQKKVVMGGGNRASKIVLDPKELTKMPNVTVVNGLAHPKE